MGKAVVKIDFFMCPYLTFDVRYAKSDAGSLYVKDSHRLGGYLFPPSPLSLSVCFSVNATCGMFKLHSSERCEQEWVRVSFVDIYNSQLLPLISVKR
jgi:hypothetical protein